VNLAGSVGILVSLVFGKFNVPAFLQELACFLIRV
jgi:hypothetical protein